MSVILSHIPGIQQGPEATAEALFYFRLAQNDTSHYYVADKTKQRIII